MPTDPQPSSPLDATADAGLGTSIGAWYSAFANSHKRLSKLVSPLDPAELVARSYANEWSIAQVLSHLGSGAEIFILLLDAGLDNVDPPGREKYPPIWERWNAKSPGEQANDALLANATLLERIGALDERQRADWRLEMFSGVEDLSGFLRLRVGEHAGHTFTWDVEVTRDDSATIAPDAVSLLIDSIDRVVARSGKPVELPVRIGVTTHAPERSLTLELGEKGALLVRGDRGDGNLDATLGLSAEALIRLVYGRLDPQHTPHLTIEGVEIELLRRTFSGF